MSSFTTNPSSFGSVTIPPLAAMAAMSCFGLAVRTNTDLVDWIEVPTEHFEICLNFEDFGVPVDLPWLSHVVALTTAIAAFDDMVPGVLEDVDADIRSRADHS